LIGICYFFFADALYSLPTLLPGSGSTEGGSLML